MEFCPNCNEKLVDSFTVEVVLNYNDAESINEEWVPVVRLTSTRYTDMLLNGLRAKNIPAYIQDNSENNEQNINYNTTPSKTVYRGYTLMVPKKYLFDADREAESILGSKWEEVQFGDEDE